MRSHEFYEALKATFERREKETRGGGGRERERDRDRDRERGRERGERERDREFGVSGSAGRRRSRRALHVDKGEVESLGMAVLGECMRCHTRQRKGKCVGKLWRHWQHGSLLLLACARQRALCAVVACGGIWWAGMPGLWGYTGPVTTVQVTMKRAACSACVLAP